MPLHQVQQPVAGAFVLPKVTIKAKIFGNSENYY